MRPTARATQEDDVASTVDKVGVVGLGTMGSGIAQLCIQAGVPTVAIEGSDELVERGRGRIDTQLARAVEKGRLEAGERERMLGLLDATTDVSSLAGCDLVIEAVFEDLAVKLELFGRVEQQLADDAVLATNTSALSVTQIAGGLERPGRLVGMHFFNPAPVLPLVEIVRSELSDDDAFDTAYEILETMYAQSRNQLHAPTPILKQMITAGLLGRKSGRGFYTYAEPHSSKVVPDADTPSGALPDDVTVRDVQRVGVVGTGTMATGIVEVLAKAGLDVVVRGRSESKVAAALGALRKSLEKGVVRGKLTEEERDATLARVGGTTRLEDLADVDLVVEAIAEELDVKRAVFAALDEICKPGAILASTTSSLPVVECAAATARPGDVVGMHFFNPAPVMKLVEVVSTVTTAPDVALTVRTLCERIDKVPVSCGDRSGFIVNALLFPYLNDAVKMLEAHYATVDDIDAAMKTGCALPMGPFELLDVVGLDVSLAIERSLYAEFREAGFAPAPLLEHLVTAGRLGRKTGHGFRDYNVR